MKIQSIFRKTLAVCSLLAASHASATTMTLPVPNSYEGQLYNSFNIYSLDLLATCSALGDPRCLPAAGVPVASSAGNIADQAVVLAGSNGNGVDNTPVPFSSGSAVDPVFLTPSGNQGSTYATSSASDPNGFTGDQAGTWEIKLSLLQQYLGTHDLVFLFDNNQAQSKTAANLLLWAQARIIDANGNQVGTNCYEFSMGSTGCGTTNPTSSAYVPALSSMCIDANGVPNTIGATGQSACPSGSLFVSNNTGNSTAEYAAYTQALNTAAKDAANSNNFLSINVKFMSNEGGAEQLWICSQCDIGEKQTNLPEPGSLMLIGLGMLGLTVRRFSKK